METFLWAQGVALTEQGHACERTHLFDPADAEAASLVTIALRDTPRRSRRRSPRLQTALVAFADGVPTLAPGACPLRRMGTGGFAGVTEWSTNGPSFRRRRQRGPDRHNVPAARERDRKGV